MQNIFYRCILSEYLSISLIHDGLYVNQIYSKYSSIKCSAGTPPVHHSSAPVQKVKNMKCSVLRDLVFCVNVKYSPIIDYDLCIKNLIIIGIKLGFPD